MRGRESLGARINLHSAQCSKPKSGAPTEAGPVRGKCSLLPLKQVLRPRIVIMGVLFIPMKSPTKWVFIGEDEQRRE